jgi:uncharacterized damage-inducible protein DinB
MIRVKPWTERTFELGLPPWRFPLDLERLRGVPARVEDLTAGMYRNELCARVEDKWSIQEHIGHLVDIEALGLGRLDDFVAGLDSLRAADMTNRKTHEADHNSREIAELLAELKHGRVLFVARLEKMPDEMLARTALHPRLKQPMRIVDLMYFIAEHDDHHIAKMRENILGLTNM